VSAASARKGSRPPDVPVRSDAAPRPGARAASQRPGAPVAADAQRDWPQRLYAAAEQLGALLLGRRWTLATAESCTAGGVAYAVTQIAGSSAWFDRGFVTYTNRAKCDLLGVPAQLLRAHGAVSEPVAAAMACGALAASGAELAVAVSGIAGPGGGSRLKPVGTVCCAWAQRAQGAGAPAVRVGSFRFHGDRAAVRTQAIAMALGGLIEWAQAEGSDRPILSAARPG